MKKLFSVVLVLIFALGTLSGCGGSSAEEPKRPANEIPSPMFYLGGDPFSEEENRYTFLYDTALTMLAAEDYAELLSNEYGMTLKVKETDEEYCIWYLENEEDPAISVKLSCKDYDGVYELDFVFGENVVLIDAEEWSIPADEVPEEPAAEEPQITTPTLSPQESPVLTAMTATAINAAATAICTAWHPIRKTETALHCTAVTADAAIVTATAGMNDAK